MYGQLGLGKNKNTNPGQLVAEKSPRLVTGDLRINHLVCGLDNTILGTEGRSTRAKSLEIKALTPQDLFRWIYLWYGMEC